jgi:hypothetical protein
MKTWKALYRLLLRLADLIFLPGYTVGISGLPDHGGMSPATFMIYTRTPEMFVQWRDHEAYPRPDAGTGYPAGVIFQHD